MICGDIGTDAAIIGKQCVKDTRFSVSPL